MLVLPYHVIDARSAAQFDPQKLNLIIVAVEEVIRFEHTLRLIRRHVLGIRVADRKHNVFFVITARARAHFEVTLCQLFEGEDLPHRRLLRIALSVQILRRNDRNVARQQHLFEEIEKVEANAHITMLELDMAIKGAERSE